MAEHPMEDRMPTTPEAQQELALGILVEVADERARQNAKWGVQNHPNGTGFERVCRPALLPRDKTYGNIGSYAKQITDSNADHGRVTYADILLEEVFEALAESDPAALRAELIQCAAVAVQWIEKLDRIEAAA
jgi:hypothetical protein